MTKGGKKIALIEDDLLILDIYSRGLRKAGFEVMTAKNGDDGYRMVKKHVPDLIISDIIMPKEDGYYLIKKVKTNSITKKVPLVALTNLDSNDDKDEAFRLGADVVLLKARFTPSELVQKIIEILENY